MLVMPGLAQVRYQDLLHGPADNWLTYAGDYQGQRHSALKQISAANAGSLVPKWVYHMPKANGLRTNPIVYNNISNGLNGFQFSYDIPPNQIQVVVQAYATANLAMYDDMLWAKYRLGEIFKVQDPATGEPAVRNLWFTSKNAPPDQPPADRANAYYSDISIQGLQRRGVLFLI